MHRSASASKVSDKLLYNSSPSLRTSSSSGQLPTYDPLSDIAKKERSRLRFAETAIHAIPILLILSANDLNFTARDAPLPFHARRKVLLLELAAMVNKDRTEALTIIYPRLVDKMFKLCCFHTLSRLKNLTLVEMSIEFVAFSVLLKCKQENIGLLLGARYLPETFEHKLLGRKSSLGVKHVRAHQLAHLIRQTPVGPEITVETAQKSFSMTTASSKAQQAPCPRFGVIGCHASLTSTTLPAEA
ncbi:hypothetical protein RJ641_035266 [Dillenia turbinata]|uniref:Uncharacterized protein n=1 Tax=Dillenia turbinata TaxID=194707 RepID=A0AAN8VSP3_9MAGN